MAAASILLALGVLLLPASAGAAANSRTGSTHPTKGSASTVSSSRGTPSPRPLKTPATITVINGPSKASETYMAALLADYFGEFKKENLTVNFITATDAASVPLLVSNKAQVAIEGYNAGLFNAISAGATFRWVLPIGATGPTDLTGIWAQNQFFKNGKFDACIFKNGVNGSPVKFSFGSPTGAGSVIIAYYGDLIRKCPGLSLKEALQNTTPANLAGPDLLTGLQTGALNSSLLYDPLTSTPGIRKYASPAIVVSQMPSVAGQDQSGYAMSGQFMKSQPKVAEAFLRAVIRTERTYLQGNFLKSPKVVKAMVSVSGLPESAVSTFDPLIFNPGPMRSEKFIKLIQQDWLEVGGVLNYNKPLPVSKIVNTSLVNKVLAQG